MRAIRFLFTFTTAAIFRSDSALTHRVVFGACAPAHGRAVPLLTYTAVGRGDSWPIPAIPIVGSGPSSEKSSKVAPAVTPRSRHNYYLHPAADNTHPLRSIPAGRSIPVDIPAIRHAGSALNGNSRVSPPFMTYPGRYRLLRDRPLVASKMASFWNSMINDAPQR
jgi:hypothetical protein